MSTPVIYYTDEQVTLWLGDCRDLAAEWCAADLLVSDPPYGRNWKQGPTGHGQHAINRHRGIHGDRETTTRDQALAAWGDQKPAVIFGDLLIPPPPNTRQVLVWQKPPDAGSKGTFAGYRRDLEAIYLIGPWPAGHNGDSSVLRSGARNSGNPVGLAARYGHPHAKPVDVLCDLIGRCPPGVVADPFAGSGSTLVAARWHNRKAVGVEIEERYCEMAARRFSQAMLDYTELI